MSLTLTRKKHILILLMAGCLFFSLTAHSAAVSIHADADECRIKAPCLACAVSLRSDSQEINPSPLAALYYTEIIITSPVIAPEPFYHPPR